MSMKKIIYGVMFSAMAGLTLLGCYPQGPEYVEDLDVVYTTYDEEYDFQAQNTFALPDKIVVDVEIDGGDTTWIYMKDAFATPILNSIVANMEANGWERLPNDVDGNPDLDADVVLSPALISSTTYYYSYWYDWYYGWYGGYWGWYYPPYYSVSSVTTGSMVIVMADPGAADDSPIGKSKASWLAVANGVATGYNDISRVTDAIDQAFEQSPYLKIN